MTDKSQINVSNGYGNEGPRYAPPGAASIDPDPVAKLKTKAGTPSPDTPSEQIKEYKMTLKSGYYCATCNIHPKDEAALKLHEHETHSDFATSHKSDTYFEAACVHCGRSALDHDNVVVNDGTDIAPKCRPAATKSGTFSMEQESNND